MIANWCNVYLCLQPAERFTLAQPLNSTWNGTQDATSYPPFCIGYGIDDTGHELSEVSYKSRFLSEPCKKQTLITYP